MKKKAVAVLALSVFFASCSKHADPANLVLEFQDIKNDGNVDSALEMFAENASLHFGSMGSISGLDNIRGVLEYDVAIGTNIYFDDCQTLEVEVVCRTTETNDWLRLADIGSITYDESRFSFTSDGRIKSVVATVSPGSLETLGSAMTNFNAWAKANRPAEYDALFRQDGTFDYSYDNGIQILELLRQWRGD